MRSRHTFLYELGFAAVNAAEALVLFLTLGIYSPGWVMAYAAWHTRRSFRRKQ